MPRPSRSVHQQIRLRRISLCRSGFHRRQNPFRPLFRFAFSSFLGCDNVVWYEQMNALKETIIEKLDSLPEPSLRLVMDYLTFLRWRGAGEESSLLSVAGGLSGTPVSAAEIDRELYGQREAR